MPGKNVNKINYGTLHENTLDHPSDAVSQCEGEFRPHSSEMWGPIALKLKCKKHILQTTMYMYMLNTVKIGLRARVGDRTTQITEKLLLNAE